jgi:hypothetical protein
MNKPLFRMAVFSLVVLICFGVGCKKESAEKTETETTAQEEIQPAEIPQVVMDALKAKFPDAVIEKWTKEKEGEVVLYDVEFQQLGHKFEADIKEDGSIHNWEQAVIAEELPDVVRQAAEKAYPNATFKEVMMITAVQDGQDSLEGYEIVLQTADEKEVEITIAPDGTMLEDSGKE